MGQFFCSTKQLSFLRWGRERVNVICCRVHQRKSWSLMNSDPLSESRPSSGKGRDRLMSCTASKHQRWALLRTARISVQPVATQTRSKAWQYSPAAWPPSWATRSTSQSEEHTSELH